MDIYSFNTPKDTRFWKIVSTKNQNINDSIKIHGKQYKVLGKAEHKHPALPLLFIRTAIVLSAVFSLGLTVILSKKMRSCFKENAINKVFLQAISSTNTSKLAEIQKYGATDIQGRSFGVYLVANEIKDGVADTLKESMPTNTNQGIHIGCAGLYNFDIMCIRKPEYGLIFDYNQNNKKFINQTIDFIKKAATREEFAKCMQIYINDDKAAKNQLFAWKDNQQQAQVYENFKDECGRQGSWLSSDDNYKYIRDLVRQDHILAISQDITNTKAFTNIVASLKSNNIPIDTVYLSNICDFTKEEKAKRDFLSTTNILVEENTYLICCHKRERKEDPLTLYVHKKDDFAQQIYPS